MEGILELTGWKGMGLRYDGSPCGVKPITSLRPNPSCLPRSLIVLDVPSRGERSGAVVTTVTESRKLGDCFAWLLFAGNGLARWSPCIYVTVGDVVKDVLADLALSL